MIPIVLFAVTVGLQALGQATTSDSTDAPQVRPWSVVVLKYGDVELTSTKGRLFFNEMKSGGRVAVSYVSSDRVREWIKSERSWLDRASEDTQLVQFAHGHNADFAVRLEAVRETAGQTGARSGKFVRPYCYDLHHGGAFEPQVELVDTYEAINTWIEQFLGQRVIPSDDADPPILRREQLRRPIPLVQVAYLGVGFAMRSEGHADGIEIVDLAKNSPAEECGLIVGDRLLSIDGRCLPPSELTKLIDEKRPGDSIIIRVRRSDNEFERRIVLGDKSKILAWRRSNFVMMRRGDALRDVRGERVTTLNELRGKPVLLLLGRIRDEVMQRQVVVLDFLRLRYQSLDLSTLVLDLGCDEDWLRQFALDNHLKSLAVPDDKWHGGMSVGRGPMWFLIDRDGTLVGPIEPERVWEVLEGLR